MGQIEYTDQQGDMDPLDWRENYLMNLLANYWQFFSKCYEEKVEKDGKKMR